MATERGALVAAILDAPDDDVPRLVFADWVEEQGGEANVARADFIRTQVERARIPPEDERQCELQARELRLLKRFGPIWCGSHHVFKKCRFRRGFIESVHLHLQHYLHHRRQMLALEPVREIRMTGWHRAPLELICRVANCEELAHLDSLTIHHQGPHKDSRGNMVSFLESPHLTQLRKLHCSGVQFDADARRRFEQLPILRGIQELQIPTLDTLMLHPGDWFSDGGLAQARQWSGLCSLCLPYYHFEALLRHLVTLPFWDRLETLIVPSLPYQGINETLLFLADHLPQSLKEFHLATGFSPADFSGAGGFFDRLAQRPLRCVHFDSVRLSTDAWRDLFEGNRWQLRELSLTSCDITAARARILAECQRLATVWALNLSGNWNLAPAGARALFASPHLRSVAYLNLSGTRIGIEGVRALSAVKDWIRLRSLDLSGTGVDASGLKALLASPSARRLTWLGLSDGASREDPLLNFSPELAKALTQLPHLAAFSAALGQVDTLSKQVLERSDSLAWPWILCDADYDVQNHRGMLAASRWPPVDVRGSYFAGGGGRENGGAPV